MGLPSQPPDELLQILIEECSLSLHLETDPLEFSPLFPTWHSRSPYGASFGAEDGFTNGRYGFFFRNSTDDLETMRNFLSYLSTLPNNQPTRFVCLVPSGALPQDGYITIATMTGNPLRCPEEMSLILITNKESLVVDPIHWESLRSRLCSWSPEWTVPNATDALFRERVGLTHQPRKSVDPQISLRLGLPRLYSFFNAHSPYDPSKARSLRSIPPDTAGLIDACNKHPPFLSVLGILPNQLRRIIKEAKAVPHDEAMTDLSRTLFFSGYRIWNLRKKLSSAYWKEIAPENRNFRANKKKKKKYRTEDMAIRMNCKNPFHFLTRHLKLSSLRRTVCECTHDPVVSKISATKDIRSFLYKFPSIVNESRQNSPYPSQDDFVRMQHDRGKIRTFDP
jgi:hypothetical protein